MANKVPSLKTKTLPTGLTYYVAYPHLPRKGKAKDRFMASPEYLIGHHWGKQIKKLSQDTLGEKWNILVATANLHLKKSYTRGIQYHWAIFMDGTTYYTREDHEWENHCSNSTINKKSVGASFVCDTTKQGLSEAQKMSFAKLARYYNDYKSVRQANVMGHKEVARKSAPTACPGTAGMTLIKNYRDGVYDKPYGELVESAPNNTAEDGTPVTPPQTEALQATQDDSAVDTEINHSALKELLLKIKELIEKLFSRGS